MKKRNLLKSTAVVVTFLLLYPVFTTKKRDKGKKKLHIDDELLVLTYNIGDCTLGKVDYSIPYEVARDNLKKIISYLDEKDYDISLLQESNWFNGTNYLINPSKKIAKNFSSNSFIYGSNSNILNYFDSGNMTLTKFDSESKRLKLPFQGEGFINDNFYVHKLVLETRIPIEESHNELIIYNIHLPAFSKNSDVRVNQIKYILELAKLEYNSGNYVVIGGDWNFSLDNIEFTDAVIEVFKDSPWEYEVLDMPTHMFINKNNETKYSSIDGFFISPNLEGDIKSLEMFDYSDHSPVEMKLRLKK